jgi:hypothetical protein
MRLGDGKNDTYFSRLRRTLRRASDTCRPASGLLCFYKGIPRLGFKKFNIKKKISDTY